MNEAVLVLIVSGATQTGEDGRSDTERRGDFRQSSLIELALTVLH